MMKIDKIILSIRKTIKFRMILFFLIILSILAYTPPIIAQESNDDVDYKAIIDSLEYNDTELWEGLYYGIIQELMPIYEEPYDMNLRKWNSVDEIYKGIQTLKLISNFNPTLPSVYEKILSNKTRNILVQKLFELRSDLSDLWWHNFDESVLAYSILIELKVTNITLNELNMVLNNSLILNSYFENIAYEKIEENHSLQPNWKNITLLDLLVYRMKDYSSYQKILLDPYSLEMKFENVILAQANNLVTLQDLGLNMRVKQKVIDNKDKPIREKIVNNEINKIFNYLKSYYTAFYDKSDENEESLLQINTTNMIEQYPEIFDSNDYNFNELSNFNTPMRISVTISNMTNLLVSKKLFDAGLIYYTQFDTKTYEVSTPNDHWDMDENGSLIFVQEILNDTYNVLIPANGTWKNEYTFIPENQTAYGEFIWNTTIMDQPQSYKVYLEIESQKYTMTQNGEGSQEFIVVLPSMGKMDDINAKLIVEQMTINLTQTENKIFDEEFYSSILEENVTIYNDKLYYAPGGFQFDEDWGDIIIDENNVPMGAVEVNDTYLQGIATESTYDYSYTYEKIFDVNYTLIVTIPDIIIYSYDKNVMEGELGFYKNDDFVNNFGIQEFNVKMSQIQEPINYEYKNYEYSFIPGLNSNNYEYENTYFLFYKNYVNLLSVNVDEYDALEFINSDNLKLTIQSYLMKINNEAQQFLVIDPILNFYYQNATFSQMYSVIKSYKSLFDQELSNNLIKLAVNNIIEWAWNWYNDTNGYFRNSIIETEYLLRIFDENSDNIKNSNKFTFMDTVTLINTTLQNYVNQYYGPIEEKSNTSIINIDYPAEDNEGEIARKYNILSILSKSYTQYEIQRNLIIEDLIQRNITSDEGIRTIIEEEYSNRHESGNELINSMILIQGTNLQNQTSDEFTQNVNRISSEMAQQRLLSEELANNPNIRYAMIENSASSIDIIDTVGLLTQYGIDPQDAIKLASPRRGGNLPNLKDEVVNLIKIMSPDLHEGEKLPSNSYLDNHPDLYWLVNKIVLILLSTPLFYAIFYKSYRQTGIIFGLFCAMFMVIEYGAMGIASAIDSLTTFGVKLINDYSKVAERELYNLGEKNYLTSYFGKILKTDLAKEKSPWSTSILTPHERSTTNLLTEYSDYVETLRIQREFSIIIQSQNQYSTQKIESDLIMFQQLRFDNVSTAQIDDVIFINHNSYFQTQTTTFYGVYDAHTGWLENVEVNRTVSATNETNIYMKISESPHSADSFTFIPFVFGIMVILLSRRKLIRRNRHYR